MSFTQSEQLFESFCKSKRIRCVRIDPSSTRTPDYDIFVPRRKVVVEIKEISPNREELDAQRKICAGELGIVNCKPGQRVRGKISDALPQIKLRTKGRFPGLLVLMDTGFAAEHTSPYNIRAAMFGFEALKYAVPSDPSHSPYVWCRTFGGKRKMTPDHNTSISGIAVMASISGSIDFRIYHNPYACVPLPPTIFHYYHVTQYALAPRTPRTIADWVQLSPS